MQSGGCANVPESFPRTCSRCNTPDIVEVDPREAVLGGYVANANAFEVVYHNDIMGINMHGPWC